MFAGLLNGIISAHAIRGWPPSVEWITIDLFATVIENVVSVFQSKEYSLILISRTLTSLTILLYQTK